MKWITREARHGHVRSTLCLVCRYAAEEGGAHRGSGSDTARWFGDNAGAFHQ
ncbi:MAG: hypothetical protein HZC24_08780 [Rhodocyclales bacterium]|nr:hypothetical protein [Rhodocyclales bacterium]